MQIKALLMPRVIRFLLISTIRVVGIVAICLVIGAEIQEIVRNIQGYVAVVRHDPEAQNSNSTSASSSSSATYSSFTSASLPSFAPAPTRSIPDSEPIDASPTESAELVRRTVVSYAAAMGPISNTTTATTTTNDTISSSSHGYVANTTVPDHAGGIIFSTLFRFLNVLVLFFLLVSEISPPWPIVSNFYLRFFPPLSEDSSVGFLGGCMIWIATAVLSTDVELFAMISAWILFVIGVMNVLLGLIMGPSLREHRALFHTDRTTRPLLPTTNGKSSNKSKKSQVSYPAPIADIGFPKPAMQTRGNESVSFNIAGAAFDVASYAHQQYKEHRAAQNHNGNPTSDYNRHSETLERHAMSQPTQPLPINRARSGKGVVTIKTPDEEAADARLQEEAEERAAEERRAVAAAVFANRPAQPPSYAGQA